MNVAIPHWQGRVSPVFDVAGSVLIVEIGDGGEGPRREVGFEERHPQTRAARLKELGADVLICGAISRPLETAVAACGIEVIAQTCGDVESVLAAFREGRLGQGTFLMPGCCGGRRRFRGGGCGRGGGGGMGGGRGGGRGGGGRGPGGGRADM